MEEKMKDEVMFTPEGTLYFPTAFYTAHHITLCLTLLLYCIEFRVGSSYRQDNVVFIFFPCFPPG